MDFLQFLVIVTVILSLLLFFFEHEAQPEIYNNGFASVSWAFARYIGDPEVSPHSTRDIQQCN